MGCVGRRNHGLDADCALHVAHTYCEQGFTTQLAIKDDAGDDEHCDRQCHQEQHLPGHDRLRDTMVRIVAMPTVSDVTAIAKTVRPCGSVNSVLR